MLNDNLKLHGQVSIAINGEVVQETNNMVVTDGKNWVSDRMADVGIVMSHMAIGSNDATEALGQTTLSTEVNRNVLTSTTTTTSTNTVVYVGTWGANDPSAGADTTVKEAGIFNHATAGDMLARVKFATITKAPADTLTITWTITVG